MNNRSTFSKIATAGLVAAAALLGAASASAGPSWAIGVALPGLYVGAAEPGQRPPVPYYHQAPAPDYRPAPPAFRAPGYYAPQPVYYEPPHRWDGYGDRGRWEGEHRDHDHDRGWDRGDRRPDWNERR